jgi:hypothetical protein
MRAFAVQSVGEPASVQDLPVPAVDDAVLIRVRFAGVNPLDNNLLGRLDAESSYPFVVGIDFAGVAERVPPGDQPPTPTASMPSLICSAVPTPSGATPMSSGPAATSSRPSSRPTKAGSPSGTSPRTTIRRARIP